MQAVQPGNQPALFNKLIRNKTACEHDFLILEVGFVAINCFKAT